jgi:hypothetical protein
MIDFGSIDLGSPVLWGIIGLLIGVLIMTLAILLTDKVSYHAYRNGAKDVNRVKVAPVQAKAPVWQASAVKVGKVSREPPAPSTTAQRYPGLYPPAPPIHLAEEPIATVAPAHAPATAQAKTVSIANPNTSVLNHGRQRFWYYAKNNPEPYATLKDAMVEFPEVQNSMPEWGKLPKDVRASIRREKVS